MHGHDVWEGPAFCNVVEQLGLTVRAVGAAPVPAHETVFQRDIALIAVQISESLPAQRWIFKVHFDAGAGCDRCPPVQARCVQMPDRGRECAWEEADRPPHPPWQGHGSFIDPDLESRAIPVQTARADRQSMGIAFHLVAPALGHRPACRRIPDRGSVQGQVHRAEVQRIALAASPGTKVIRRKNTSQQGDTGQAVTAIVAQGVDVPPSIAIGRDRRIEPRSAMRLCAASRPDWVDIAIPGPGCVLPPAR